MFFAQTMITEISPSVYVPALLGLLITVGSHQLTASRERRAKRRELRLAYLLKCYRSFSKAVGHPRLYEINDELREAIADVQFLGSTKQIELAVKITQTLAAGGTAEITPLLSSLRNELRRELGLEAITGNIWWLQVSKKEQRNIVHEQ